MHRLILPIIVPISTKKNFSLNLNQYRNAHHFTLNNSKKIFKEMIEEQVTRLPVFQAVSLEYVLYVGSKRELDISNVCCVVDKYFSDALVELGKLPDDNYKYLNKITYTFGGYDKGNARVEVIINEIHTD